MASRLDSGKPVRPMKLGKKRLVCTAAICSRDVRGDRRTGRKKCWRCPDAREVS